MRHIPTRPSAHFDWSLRGNIVCIVDRNTGMSVTNDAENVIAKIIAAGVDPATHRFVYSDTEGRWDELVVYNGRFDGFRHVGGTDLEDALSRLP